jgi:type VI secretion system protein ImpH
LGEENGASGQLGLGAVAGDEIWDQQARVRLRLGPLKPDRYNDFLPNGNAHALLRWIVRFFSRDAFDFELQLVMDREDVPGCVLGDDDAAPQPLSWCTWIRTEPFARHADDTVVRL